MTEEERRNRNPKPELVSMSWAEFLAKPKLKATDLLGRRVYYLWKKSANAPPISINYQGRLADGTHWFFAPRINLSLLLFERPDGSGFLEDGRGIEIEVRLYDGPDA
jgi:hypothetical protein